MSIDHCDEVENEIPYDVMWIIPKIWQWIEWPKNGPEGENSVDELSNEINECENDVMLWMRPFGIINNSESGHCEKSDVVGRSQKYYYQN